MSGQFNDGRLVNKRFTSKQSTTDLRPSGLKHPIPHRTRIFTSLGLLAGPTNLFKFLAAGAAYIGVTCYRIGTWIPR